MVRASDHVSIHHRGPAPHPLCDLAAVRPHVEHEHAAQPGPPLASSALGARGAPATRRSRLAAARGGGGRHRQLRPGLHLAAAEHAAGRPGGRARACARDAARAGGAGARLALRARSRAGGRRAAARGPRATARRARRPDGCLLGARARAVVAGDPGRAGGRHPRPRPPPDRRRRAQRLQRPAPGRALARRHDRGAASPPAGRGAARPRAAARAGRVRLARRVLADRRAVAAGARLHAAWRRRPVGAGRGLRPGRVGGPPRRPAGRDPLRAAGAGDHERPRGAARRLGRRRVRAPGGPAPRRPRDRRAGRAPGPLPPHGGRRGIAARARATRLAPPCAF